MKRRHLIELHEQTWFPEIWRKMFQEGLGMAQSLLGVYEHAATPMEKMLRHSQADEVLDLCSGSAGIVMDLVSHLAPELRPKVVVSDLYPNVSEFERLEQRFAGQLTFYPSPVDAFSPPQDAPRVRSIISALHHFKPDQVRLMLQDAAHHADGFIALESTGRTWTNMLMSLPLPLPAALLTSFRLRPWRPQHLLWGLLIPVVPLVALIDGLVSNIRTYSADELREITDSLDNDGFHWEAGTVPMPRSPLEATYLIGWREKSPGSATIG